MLDKIRPYINLVSNNRHYRRLWLSQVVSNFGDWFGLLAVYALITQYSDSEFLLGLIIVVKMMSLASFSPFAGYLTDRFNRRRIMIVCDLLRGLIVLGLLLVVSYETLWLAYVLTALQMMLSAIFEPAKTSSIPNVTTEEELVDANVLSSASWSIIFTLGMGFGGLATAWLGTDLVFIIDAFTYVISALFIYWAVIPQKKMDKAELERTRNPLVGIKEGFQYLFNNHQILRPSLAKGVFTMCLGGLTYMLILVSEDVLLMGSVGIGLLYAARGVGTGVGPIIGRRIFNREKDWVRAMGFSMIFGGLMYAVVGLTTSLAIMMIFVFIAHAASGANWVMSTVLLQRRTPDTFRGRIFSTEWLLFTLTQSASVLLCSWILENKWLTIQETMVVYALALSVSGLVWHLTVTSQEKEYQDVRMIDKEEMGKMNKEQYLD